MRAAGTDAVVVGAGPNGLAAAVTLAQAGRSVLVLEASETPGGGARTAELTLPGFHHDVCSAIHPLALASPFFRSVPLSAHGLRFVQPPAPLAHPLDGGRVGVMERSITATVEGMGEDGPAWEALMGPLVSHAGPLVAQVLGPLRPPRHPLVFARFAAWAALSATALARLRFRRAETRGLVAGIAAHSMLPLTHVHSAGYSLLLGLLGHWVGWPIPVGGSQAITDALVSLLRSLGGEVVTGVRVGSMEDLPGARAYLFDTTPRALADIAGPRLSRGYLRALRRFRYGPGVFKVDWALRGPIPWKAEACARAGTLHLGGALEEIAGAEKDVSRGRVPERPFVLLAQPSLFDPTRAPAGKHSAWAYCHVPNGSSEDMTERIEAQVERFAPGFGRQVLARSSMSPVDMERYNPNYIGGDINGGIQDLRQLYTRPAIRPVPYTTPAKDIYICSSSTPPGGGVHGMCGYWAARSALRRAW
jgi:phytoene dehydrogenase-like protein